MMQSDNCIIYLYILNEVLKIIHIFSKYLQLKAATIGNS